MTPDVHTRALPSDRGFLESYRLQARLMWEWRPNRLAVVRRTVLSYVMACLALAVTAYVLRGLRIGGPVRL